MRSLRIRFTAIQLTLVLNDTQRQLYPSLPFLFCAYSPSFVVSMRDRLGKVRFSSHDSRFQTRVIHPYRDRILGLCQDCEIIRGSARINKTEFAHTVESENNANTNFSSHIIYLRGYVNHNSEVFFHINKVNLI